MVLPKAVESSVLLSSPGSGDGSSLTSTRPAGWPTITNRPANNLRIKREIWRTMSSACEGASYRRIYPSRKRIQRMKSVFPCSCQKGLAIVWPNSRRQESAYILSYQSLLSVSMNRASPEGNYPRCAKGGLAKTSSRGGYQKHLARLTFCQPQLADFLAVLLFPFREGGIELPTTLKRWHNPGKPGTKKRTIVPIALTMSPLSIR